MADIEKVCKSLEDSIKIAYRNADLDSPSNPMHVVYPIRVDTGDAKTILSVIRDMKSENERLKEKQPKKGHWEKPKFADDRWHICSECGVLTERFDKNGFKLICNFCRICGADMRGEQE